MPPSNSSPFHLGVNYPWLDYAEDFGSGPRGHLGVSSPEKYSRIKNDLSQMRESGIRVVRWFLFGDGRGGYLAKKGIPRRPDEFLLKDVAAALALAHDHNIQLCFSLIDYLWLQEREYLGTSDENARILQFAAGREAFLENVLIPLFSEFRAHPALFAWEVANEPEWAIREFYRKPTAGIHLADFRAFATEVVAAIHEFGSAFATLGSARLIWVRAWSELHLDFYQAHYYPSGERDAKTNFQQQLEAIRTLDKPLWLGELPARDASAPDYALETALNHCRDQGLCGAAVWRWTKPDATGSDVDIGALEPALLRSWLATREDLRV
jgi:hypothetical protein